MASPRERVPEKDGGDLFEDVPSEEEPKALADDPTTALERLPKLKLGAKGSSKGDKQRDKNKNKNKEEKKHKARRKVQSSPQPSSESENGDDDDEYYAQRLPKRTLKSNTKRSYSSVFFNYDSINLPTNTHINYPRASYPNLMGPTLPSGSI